MRETHVDPSKKAYICLNDNRTRASAVAPSGRKNPKEMDLSEQLVALADPAYRDFNARLIPGAGEMLGVRIPRLRQLARQIARSDAWREFAAREECRWFEERMLQGMVIGYARCAIDEKLEWVARFVPRIDNWAVCDCFCWRLRADEREAMWRFIQPWFRSGSEYGIRFAVVMATANFIDGEHLEALLAELGAIRHEGYYARMGVAWTVSVCFVRFPERMRRWLAEECPLEAWTFSKSIQKITESFRVGEADKRFVRALRQNAK